MESHYKLQSINKTDKKFVRYMGLEPNIFEVIDLDI